MLGFLIIVQFVQSTFWNNSFGWRAVLIPVLLLMMWAAVAFSELFALRQTSALREYIGASLWQRIQPGIIFIVVLYLSVGWLTLINVTNWPIPLHQPRAEELIQRRGFLRQQVAWQKVRELTPPTARVQVNPDGYRALTSWPATLPYALFADRKIAYANVEYATVFAYRYDAKTNKKQYQLIQNVFSANPQPENLYALRDQLKIQALLIDHLDPVWNSDVIKTNGAYRLAYEETDFRIYLATE